MSHAESNFFYRSGPKEFRRLLVRHLWDHHGQFKPDLVSKVGKCSIEEMRAMHDALHLDDYMCPPHIHTQDEDGEGHWNDKTWITVSDIKTEMTLPMTYLEDIVLTSKGFELDEPGGVIAGRSE